MWTPAGRKLDVYDNPDLLAKIAEDPEAQEILSELGDTELLPVTKLAELRDDQFALVIKTADGRKLRKFPVHDPGHVVLASLYLNRVRDQLPDQAVEIARGQISKAAKKQGGQKELSKEASSNEYRVWEDKTGSVKIRRQRTTSPSFALVKTGSDGRTHKYLPCHTPLYTHRSMRAFESDHMSFSPVERKKIARSFKVASDAFGIDLDDYPVVKEHIHDGANPYMKQAFDSRKSLCQDKSANDTLDELYESRDSFSKIGMVQLLEQWDRDQGLDKYWRTPKYPDPYWSVYGSEKTGRDKTAELAQKIADNKDLLVEVLGEEKAAMFQEHPKQVYNSLPRPLKATLAAGV